MAEVVGIVGSRDYGKLDAVQRYVEALDPDTVIVSGGARGVDTAAEDAAKSLGRSVISFRVFDRGDGWFNVERWWYGDDGKLVSIRRIANGGRLSDGTTASGSYRSFGAAAFVRNGYIVEWADRVVAFYDGTSKGTKLTMDLAAKAGKLDRTFR